VPYWTRVFCVQGPPASLASVFEWAAAERHVELSVDREMTPHVDLDAPFADQAAIRYTAGKMPFLAEVNRRGDSELDLADELEEFLERLEEARAGPARERVAAHLGRTDFVVANQLPLSDFEDDGFDALGAFMTYFAERNGGLIHADGEGFYDGEELILELD
jgi:hypothetical protein